MSLRALLATLALVGCMEEAAPPEELKLTPGAVRWEQWRSAEREFPLAAWAYMAHEDYGASVADFEQYAGAGLNTVPIDGDPGRVARAREAGLDVAAGIWADVWDNAQRLDGLVEAAPELLLLEDESEPELWAQLGDAHAYVYQHVPEAMSLLTVHPIYAPRSGPVTWDPTLPCHARGSYCEYLTRFVAETDVSAIAATHYPTLDEGEERDDYYETLEAIRSVTQATGRGMMTFILTTPHQRPWPVDGRRYRDPTEADLRWQAYSGLAYGAQGLWYYAFRTKQRDVDSPDWRFGQGIVHVDGSEGDKFGEVARLNCEVQAIGPTLRNLRSIRVSHSRDDLPRGAEAFDATKSVLDELQGSKLLLGEFERADIISADRWTLVVSKRTGDAQVRRVLTMSIPDEFSGAWIYDIDRQTCTSRQRQVAAGGEVVELALEPGQGALLRLAATAQPQNSSAGRI